MFLDMRKPFAGCKRQVIIAFDVGTTFSGISYAVLDPGKVPEIMSVTRYRGQEAGDAKVQTVLYYDVAGRVIAADAKDPYSDDGSDSEDEGKGFKPLKVEWFKLLFRPPTAPLDPSIPSPKLPPHKNLLGVAADYLVYLYAHVRAFIRETHASGDRLWDSVKDDAHFVLSHPNGWEGKQQSAMRRAAVMAGLVPDTLRGHERVTFVSEGEASLHYCVASGLTMDTIEKGKNIMIIDAGGGTVDRSTYSFSEGSPISVEEIAPADSIFQGSVIVRNRASAYLAKKLRYTRFGSSAYVQAITEEFDKTAKKRFKGYEDSHIKFSSTTCDRDDRVNIRNGRMKLSAEEVAGFFQPTLAAVIDAIEAQRKAAAPAEISTYLLVGGLGANEFFYARLHDYLSNQGLTLFRPDNHTRKAVAEGAVSFHIDHYVSSRVAKMSYGTCSSTGFNPAYPEHLKRAQNTFMGADGCVKINGLFCCMLPRGTRVAEETVFKMSLTWRNEYDIGTVSNTIACYRGRGPCPQWVDEDPGLFVNLCTVSADVSKVPRVPLYGPGGKIYFTQDYTLVLSFGLTEIQAHISWCDQGVEHTGPASIVYDDDYSVIPEDDYSDDETAVGEELESIKLVKGKPVFRALVSRSAIVKLYLLILAGSVCYFVLRPLLLL